MFSLTLAYHIIYIIKLTAQIGDRLHQKNTLCTLCFRGQGFHAKPIFFCNILFLRSCNSDLWRKYTLKCLFWCIEGKRWDSQFSLREQVRTALRFALLDQWQEETMYSALSQLSYLWDLKEQKGGENFKVIIWGGNASHKEGQFLWERGVLIM